MDSKEKQSGGLRAGLTPLGIWAFSIGTSIGWGSLIVTCNTYLLKSGILGTTFGLLAGMAVILVITWNLQYMIQKSPNAGGVYTFEKQIGGKDLGFLAFWFVLLTYLAILWANITSVPLFARFFLGNTFQFGFHYHIFGYEVWFGEALASIAAVALIGLLCLRSARLPNRIMIIAALTFAVGFTVCAVIAMIRHESGFSYAPLYTEGSSAFAQIVRIAAISPWAFIGFENISHFSEEYAFPAKKVRRILIWSVLITTVLYLFVSMLSVSAYPPEYENWLAYIQDMGNLEGIKAVPAFYAANYYLGSVGVTVLMLALFGVILTSLIGNMLALSRLLYAAGREGEAPRKLSALNRHGTPGNAIILIAAISVFIPFLGRTAIGWIVDVTTLGATLIYGLISLSVYRQAKRDRQRLEQTTGMTGLILMACFVLLILIPGLLPFHAMETESYVLFIVWSVLGLVYFRWLIRQDQHREHSKSFVVWIILLVLVLFASMMWVSRATERAANSTIQQIMEYHESHPADDSDLSVREDREAFLQEQAKQIASTTTLYTIVSLALFLLSTAIMLNNYRDTRKLGERLSVAEEAAKESQSKVENLNRQIYVDALTHVRNRGGYEDYIQQLQARLDRGEELDMAIGVFDCDNLKTVNDQYGHDKGNLYLQASSGLICRVFQHSPVFRIGGDEFVVVLLGEDYENRDALIRQFNEKQTAISASAQQGWEKVSVASGIAVYDPLLDLSLKDLARRADQLMYENKRNRKEAGRSSQNG